MNRSLLNFFFCYENKLSRDLNFFYILTNKNCKKCLSFENKINMYWESLFEQDFFTNFWFLKENLSCMFYIECCTIF